MANEITTILKALIGRITGAGCEMEGVPNTARIFDDCGIDSVSVVEFVLEIERTFDISISQDELDPDIFNTITTLTYFISRKQIEHQNTSIPVDTPTL